jgi:hypothetical protein
LAVTGVVGYQFSNDASQPNLLNWGFTLQYSYQYLHNFVERSEWSKPLERFVAVVEFPMQNCLTGVCSGKLIGSINPGVVWIGPEFNINVQVIFPCE